MDNSPDQLTTRPSAQHLPDPSAAADHGGGVLARISEWSRTHRRIVLVVWVVALVGLTLVSRSVKGEHRADYNSPGTDSSAASVVLDERFPTRAGDTVTVAFATDQGIDDARPAIDTMLDEMASIDHVADVTSPWDEGGGGQIAEDGDTGFATIQLDGLAAELPSDVGTSMIDTADAASTDGLDVELAGQTIDNAQGGPVASSELFGMIAAAIILLIAFGSVIAMGLPLLVAVFGVGIGLAFGEIMTRFIDVPDWAGAVASMIGVGVGIDYALLIVTRYRAELAAGKTPADATSTAMSTAGRSVMFAGVTVVISLLGMLTMNQPYVAGVAFSAVLAVVVVVAAALTLLPALLGFTGTNINRFSLPQRKRHADTATSEPVNTGWHRWSHLIQRRPVTAGIAGLLALVILTVPILDLRLGFPDASNDSTELTTRRAYDMLSDGFGAGFNGTFLLVADDADPEALTTIDDLVADVQATEGIADVTGPIVNPDNDAAIVLVTPTSGPQSADTDDVLDRLRNDVIPAATAGTDLDVNVGGVVASSIDQTRSVTSRLPVFIAAVLVLSFLLLLAVFRSVLVAFKAAILNLLSILAAYGVVAYATQGGWFGQLFGIDAPTPVPAFIPMMMFAILFGLSMDYEVFILSRIREEYLRTGDNSNSVANGLASTARVITAAAAIMTAVFGAFILGDQLFLKIIGLGMASAIIIDATIVRLILVPSTMELLGDRNWWMPAWLDRIIPTLDVEPAEPAEPAEVAAPVGPADPADDDVDQPVGDRETVPA